MVCFSVLARAFFSRSHVASRCLAVVVGLWVGLASVPALADRVELDRVVVVVGNNIILKSEFQRAAARHPAYVEAMSQLPPNASKDVVEQTQRSVEAAVLDDMIALALVRDEAQKYGLGVSPEDLERAQADEARQRGLSVEEWRERIEASEEYSSWAEYLDDLEGQILLLKVPSYLTQFSVSEAEVREHYRQMAKDESERIELSQILFVPRDQAAESQDQAYALAQAVARRVREGEDIDDVAFDLELEVSEAEYARGEAPPVVEDAIFAAKEGDVVGPIGSSRGYAVFFIREHKESAALSYEEAKTRIRRQLEGEAFLKAREDFLVQLRAKSHIDVRL